MENINASFFYGASPEIFKRAGELRKNMTAAETALWKRLERKQVMGLRFRRQHPIAEFIADFYCHRVKLIVEVDGGMHKNIEVAQYDEGREFELRNMGIDILRFSNQEILTSTDTVIAKGHL